MDFSVTQDMQRPSLLINDETLYNNYNIGHTIKNNDGTKTTLLKSSSSHCIQSLQTVSSDSSNNNTSDTTADFVNIRLISNYHNKNSNADRHSPPTNSNLIMMNLEQKKKWWIQENPQFLFSGITTGGQTHITNNNLEYMHNLLELRQQKEAIFSQEQQLRTAMLNEGILPKQTTSGESYFSSDIGESNKLLYLKSYSVSTRGEGVTPLTATADLLQRMQEELKKNSSDSPIDLEQQKHKVSMDNHNDSTTTTDYNTNENTIIVTTVKNIRIREKRKKGRPSMFIKQLYTMLLDLEMDPKGKEIASFLQPNGDAFIIHQPEKLVEKILPKYFKMNALSSFKRQLNMYGFRQISIANHMITPNSTNKKTIKTSTNNIHPSYTYYHEHFICGEPQLLGSIQRVSLKEKSSRLNTF